MEQIRCHNEIRSLSFGELTKEEQFFAGGKGGSLARLYQAGYPVPAGFVIMPNAFKGDILEPGAWSQVLDQLKRLRKKNTIFSVRSSALSEDSVQASFAGEFETILNVCTNEEIQEAILVVRKSRLSERVKTYSQAKGMDTSHEMAIVIQQMVQAEISGVLFTVDPVTGNYLEMSGNYVHGLGEKLVSGEVNPHAFTFKRPKGRYEGPSELKRFSHKLYKLAVNLEKELDCPQDIEWVMAKDKLFLIQSRPITTLRGHNPIAGEWNESLTGNYLWTNANAAEAVPDVMTPSTWSFCQKFFNDTIPIKLPENLPYAANIGGRVYFSFSSVYSFLLKLNKPENALFKTEQLLGKVPEGVNIPVHPIPKFALLSMFIPIISCLIKYNKCKKNLSDFVASTPEWCREMQQHINKTNQKSALLTLWHDELKPYLYESFWMMLAGVSQFVVPAGKLSNTLTKLVGEADANTLLSNMSIQSGHIESLGPVINLSKVARGEMSRNDYLDQYGHRGPHECELFTPYPAEDPNWVDQRLAEFIKSSIDVETLISKQRAKFDEAWRRLKKRHPEKVKSIKRQIDVVSSGAYKREGTRSEATRVTMVVRKYLLRAGDLTGLKDDIFFLTLDEVTDLLSGDRSATVYIPARRAIYEKYLALPPYPVIINGRFDPFQWSKDPNQPIGVFDSNAGVSIPAPTSNTIIGIAGATGQVEGIVRRIDTPEGGGKLKKGEILVTTTTNVGWTLLFPRAAAVITDVGAPLSHAAIVARELGIPAVVGCVNATMRLHTGDRVLVDGGKGTVTILEKPVDQ